MANIQNQNQDGGIIEDYTGLVDRVGTLEATTQTLSITTQDIQTKVDRMTAKMAILIEVIQ